MSEDGDGQASAIILPTVFDMGGTIGIVDDLKAAVAGSTDVTVDGSAVERCGTPGIQILLAAARSARANGHTLHLTAASEPLKATFHTLGLAAELDALQAP